MKELHIRIKLPDDLSAEDPSVQAARRSALESAVIALWQGGRLSTRTAARRLGMNYRDYLDLLADRNIPIEAGLVEADTFESLIREVKTTRQAG
jgi:predicted HTH domain antitoxin